MGLYIFGAGGFGREVLCLVRAMDTHWQQDSRPAFVVDDEHHSDAVVMGVPCVRRSEWKPDGQVVVAIGDPSARAGVIASLPAGVSFATLVHPAAVLMDDSPIGEGSIICAGAILTCNVTLGRHVHVNAGTVVGHDAVIGDFTTLLPRSVVSGWVRIGDRTTVGANASIRDRINVCGGAFIGMAAAVVKDIDEAGTYVGVPARRIG